MILLTYEPMNANKKNKKNKKKRKIKKTGILR
jgi:hypothetical protein